MLHEESGISLVQVVVGVIIVMVLGTVVTLNVFDSIKDARLASELQKIEELKLKTLAGEEFNYLPAEVKDIKEEVRVVLGYHQSKGTNLNDVVFQDKVIESEGKRYVGGLSVEEDNLSGKEEFSLTSGVLKSFNVGPDTYYQVEERIVSKEDKTSVGVEMSAGSFHNLYKNEKGKVFSWGRNIYGQLGDGSLENQVVPVEVGGLPEGIVKVSAGNSHSLALTESGEVYSWGRNNHGQLGDGSNTNRNTPGKVTGLPEDIEKITSGEYHSVALTADGDVYSWGTNGNGELGNGGSSSNSVPVRVTALPEDISEIEAGHYHTFAMGKSHEVYAWGFNSYGQLGDGTENIRNVPVRIDDVPKDVDEIIGGSYHSFALTSSGELYSWGWNRYGQLGDGSTSDRSTPEKMTGLSDVVKIDGGYVHTVALTSEDKVYSWGNNGHGQLGDGNVSQRRSPVEVLHVDDGLQNVFAGFHHSMVLTSSGDWYGWGKNSHGELGDGSTDGRNVPVESGFIE